MLKRYKFYLSAALKALQLLTFSKSSFSVIPTIKSVGIFIIPTLFSCKDSKKKIRKLSTFIFKFYNNSPYFLIYNFLTIVIRSIYANIVAASQPK